MSTSTRERCGAEAVGAENEPYIQQAMLRARRNALTQMAASMPRATPITQSKKEQGGEEEKAHELFHPHHPGTGPRDEAEPGRLRAEEQIRRAHPRRDREEHEQDDRGRLGESEPERGAEIGRGAGRGEHGREDALEKGAGVTFARAPAEQAGAWPRPGA